MSALLSAIWPILVLLLIFVLAVFFVQFVVIRILRHK